jgi:predicted P-loop ATPase
MEFYRKKYRVVEIDKSGSDLARLCYYSFDSSAYYNSDATGWSFNYQSRNRLSTPILNTEIGGHYNTFRKDTDQANHNLVVEIIHWCNRENISLLDNYHDWIRILFALKNTFPDSSIGMDLFLQLSATSPKFNRDECINKWKETNPSNTENKVTLGTLLYMAKSCGWIPPKRVYIGTGASLNSCVTALEESNLRLKYNSLTHQLLFSEEPTEELWQLANDYIDGKVKMDILKLALKRDEYDGFMKYVPPRFNHVDDFIQSLPAWDSIDRFPKLLQTLTIKESNDIYLPGILLKKWMVGVINGLHNRPENAHRPSISPNENLLILIGPQGIGKTRWMRKLLPEPWHTLFAEKLSFNFDDKDDKLLACEKVIISMDELSPILNNKATNEQLKGFLSQKTFNIRVAYGRYNNVFFKIASFIGTSNHNEIITDPTGSRRFWPIEIEAADYEHDVDMSQLWAQTYALWKGGEKHWLSSEEQELLSSYNEPFIKSHPYEEYISRFVSHGDEFLTATQIAEYINSCLTNNNAVNPRQLGVYLKKAGYQRESRWINGATHRIYKVTLLPESSLIEAQPLVEGNNL